MRIIEFKKPNYPSQYLRIIVYLDPKNLEKYIEIDDDHLDKLCAVAKRYGVEPEISWNDLLDGKLTPRLYWDRPQAKAKRTGETAQ